MKKNMIIHEGYENLKLANPFVTIGVFDGVHLGHRALLDHLVSIAWKAGGESAVVTFNPHPRLVLSEKTEGIFYLSTLDEKKRLLAKSRIDHLIILNFTREMSNLEAVDFIREILVERIKVKHLIVGYDNHFGKNKGGDFNKIRECADFYGFATEQFGGVSSPDGIISSTAVRDALLKGNLTDANRWLGYNYSLTGTVIKGRKLGRSFGFPTANIKPADIHKLIPADGVYAVEVLFDNKQLPGMLSIGFNPTVNKSNSSRSVEAHIFNFDMDLYDKEITVIFRFRLRDEIKFKNVTLLAEQMKLDKQTAIRLLA
jgi:riboflavin kinase/FMN adenylyltransferase